MIILEVCMGHEEGAWVVFWGAESLIVMFVMFTIQPIAMFYLFLKLRDVHIVIQLNRGGSRGSEWLDM